MRFLGIGRDGSLGDLYLALIQAGHEVRTFIQDTRWRGILRGFIQLTDDWESQLEWVGRDGIILFERADQGELQDELRRRGYRVIGGSALGDRLENDRGFGQARMRQAGMTTAPTHPFADFDKALAFITARPRRYVLKLNGADHASSDNVVGDMDDGADIAAILRRHKAAWPGAAPPDFILMDHLTGVEVGVGGYFNGREFLEPVVLDFEHKRFFPGDLGELTGEMGTLLTYRNSAWLFERTLAKMAGQLRDGGYVGYININTIVNADGIWPLEFTCRFGYPGAAICSALHREDWSLLFRRMVEGDRLDFPTDPGFAVGVVLTVPPFPVAEDFSDQAKGLPLLFRRAFSDEDWRHLHLSELEKDGDGLVTTGGMGSLMAVTGTGATVEAARDAAYRRSSDIVVPGLRYRNDIGLRFLARDRTLLRSWGYWDDQKSGDQSATQMR